MKKIIAGLITFTIVLSFCLAEAQEKPRLGVLRFTNQTHAGWWRGNMGYDLQDMLVNELASTKSFQVLERKEINAVIGEQDLGASGRIDPKTKAKIGKIKGAKYLVAATVSAFEEDTKGTGGGIGIMGFRVGGKQDKGLHGRGPENNRHRYRGNRGQPDRGGHLGIQRLQSGRQYRVLIRRPGEIRENPHRQSHPGLHHRNFGLPGLLADQGKKRFLHGRV